MKQEGQTAGFGPYVSLLTRATRVGIPVLLSHSHMTHDVMGRGARQSQLRLLGSVHGQRVVCGHDTVWPGRRDFWREEATHVDP